MKIAILYGSTTGNTADVAVKIGEAFASAGEVSVNAVGDGFAPLVDADLILLGASTWGVGEIQDDWQGNEGLGGLDLTGKKVAVFGTGDQMGFGDTFVDALGILADAAEKAGAMLVGSWPTQGYEFNDSQAVRGDAFVGLALDDDNQSDRTDTRIAEWVRQILGEL